MTSEPTRAPGTVQVTGRGRVAVVPDVAVLDLAYEATADAPDVALAEAAAALAQARVVLTDHGVRPEDVRSTELGLWPEHDPTGRPSGYRAVLGLTVRTCHLESIGRLAQAAVVAGGSSSRLRGLQLLVADPAAAREQARDAAWADAHRTATRLAALSGGTLGQTLQVSDGAASDGDPGDRPGSSARFSMGQASGAPVLAVGRLEVEQALTVTWVLA